MDLSYKHEGIWNIVDLEAGGECPVCGQPVQVNKYKKEDKHPDLKCTNRNKTMSGDYECGAGFWKPKPKKPAHQLSATPSAPAAVSIELSNISNQLKIITLQLDKIWERIGHMQVITEMPDVD